MMLANRAALWYTVFTGQHDYLSYIRILCPIRRRIFCSWKKPQAKLVEE